MNRRHIAICSLTAILLSATQIAKSAEPAAKIEPVVAPDAALLAKIALLPDNAWLRLGPVKVTGDVSWCGKADWKGTEHLAKVGPTGRDYCNKAVWSPERKRALYCGANHQVIPLTNDVWEYDLAANTWICLYAPDPQYPGNAPGSPTPEQEARRLDWIKKNVVYMDGIIQSPRGAPIRPAHTWWGICYDPESRRLLYFEPHQGLIFTDTKLIARALDIPEAEASWQSKTKKKPGAYIWSFDPATRRWDAVRPTETIPVTGGGDIMEYLPDQKTYWVKTGSEGYLFDKDKGAWRSLGKSLAPYGTISAYDPESKSMVAVDAKKTYAYSFATNTWKVTQENPPAGGRDANSIFYFDPVARRFVLFSKFVKPHLWLYDLAKNEWTDPKPQGDVPPEGKGRTVGYYDPERNVTVYYDGAEVWVYRCKRKEGGAGPEQIDKLKKLGARIQLDEQKRVIGVNLGERRVNDADLALLQGLDHLQELDLTRTRITSTGLVHLKDLTGLKKLFLTETKVDDAGIGNLKGMKSLELLGLSGTKIGDPALTQLQALAGLKSVFCIGTGVTNAGVEKFQKALPNCRITH